MWCLKDFELQYMEAEIALLSVALWSWGCKAGWWRFTLNNSSIKRLSGINSKLVSRGETS